MTNYPNDFINGREVPPLVIRDNQVLTGKRQGSIYVEAGQLILDGTNQGSLSVQPGASVEILGKQQGSVGVETNSELTIHGTLQGSTSVEYGGVLVVEIGGKLAGSLSNDGKVILRGVFGGSRSGDGEFIVEGGIIKQPVVRDGVNYYEW